MEMQQAQPVDVCALVFLRVSTALDRRRVRNVAASRQHTAVLMSSIHTLLFTDLVDSTQLNQQVGDPAMARLSAEHDGMARALIRQHGGREIGRSDGFLVLFDSAPQALSFAHDYHRVLMQLPGQPTSRLGIHTGELTFRSNTQDETAGGATPYEVDGLALPIAARIMGMAMGGQTLLSADTVRFLGDAGGPHLRSAGHWRLKGVAEPIEVFQALDASATPAGREALPPPDSPKAYRVVKLGEGWVTAQTIHNNLPAERGAFVGRGALLLAVAKSWDTEGRLLTLLGLGGIGKTRLALQYARSCLGEYPGGAWFCDLSAARSADGVVFAVAQVLGEPVTGRDPTEHLGRALAHRASAGPCLVVLDNFEQVARHAEATLGRWLELAPEVRFIVTSREVLGLPGEQVLAVPPLSADEAERLFLMRAQAACGNGDLPHAALEPHDLAALPRLMDMLDCLPLALELAAARSRLLKPAALLERMSERFRLLAARGGRNDRQATLRATLDWSWELLTAPEQATLAQLAVFEGGFRMADAEGVINPIGLSGQWVPDLLQALIEKSWLYPTGAGRLGMLRTVHDYAVERLQQRDEVGTTEARHWCHFAAMTEPQAERERGIEIDNLMAACRRATLVEPVTAARLLSTAWAALRLTGPFGAAIDLGRVLLANLAPDDASRAVVHRLMGAATSLLGDMTAAREHLENAARHAAQAQDWRTWGEASGLLAGLELTAGRSESAQALLDRVQTNAAADADEVVRYTRLSTQGRLLFMAARWPQAEQAYGAALQLARDAGNARWQAGLLGNLGMVARNQGRRADARLHWQTALEGVESTGDRHWAGNTHCNLGLLLYEMGDVAGARLHLEQALSLARAIGLVRLEAVSCCNLGLVAEAQGEAALAVELQRKAVALARQLGDPRLQGQAHGYLALALGSCGQAQAASPEIDAALNLLRPLQDRGLIGLVLLQASLVAAAAGDHAGWRDALAQAQTELDGAASDTDPEVVMLMARARGAGPLGAASK